MTTTKIYRANDRQFESFLAAVDYAAAHGAEVFEIATGLRRWTPSPPVDSKRQRLYRERLAAYEAQERAKK